MSPATHATALATAATLLRPLGSLMLKCGLTWREFAALAKTAFVAAATDEYGLDGRPTNVSRVALLCGLARKEVRRQRELLADPAATDLTDKTTDATRVLSGWYQDPAFCGDDGQPDSLTRERFEELCRRYCSELPASVLLKELLRVGAIAETGDRLVARCRYYMPARADAEWMTTAGHYVADLTNAIRYNIDLDNGERSRFLGRATEIRIPASAAIEFRDFLEQEGQAFLERVDAWLGAHQAGKDVDTSVPTVRLGAGVFQIQDESASAAIAKGE